MTLKAEVRDLSVNLGTPTCLYLLRPRLNPVVTISRGASVLIASNINREASQRQPYEKNYERYAEGTQLKRIRHNFVAFHMGAGNDIMCRKGRIGLLNKRTDLTYEA